MKIESLESRQLLTVGVTVTTTGTLAITSETSVSTGIGVDFDALDSDTIQVGLASSTEDAYSDRPRRLSEPEIVRVTILEPRGVRQSYENPSLRIDDIQAALGTGTFITVEVSKETDSAEFSGMVSELYIANINDVNRILADTGFGDDSVAVSRRVRLPTTLTGGAGDDRMQGGGGYALISGGAGDDTIYARGSSSIIEGGAGKDKIWAQSSGVDNVSGGRGSDTLYEAGEEDLFSSIERRPLIG